MAKRPIDMSLEELYETVREKGKATPSVAKHIIAKEDFTEYSQDYCSTVCTNPCKHSSKLPMIDNEADILFIQSHLPFPEKYKRGSELNFMHQRQLSSMIPNGVSYETATLVKCPTNFFRAKNGKMSNKLTQTQMKGCMPYLMEEIERVKPKVIVSLTTEVTKILGLKKSNTNDRGTFWVSPLLDIPVVITLHPKVLNMIRQNASGGMWGDDYYPVIRRDIAKAISIAEGDLELQDIETVVEKIRADQITVCRSIDEVRKWTDVLMSLDPRTITSWDLETTSLDPWAEDARILTSQVGYRRDDGKIHAVVIPLWHRANDCYDPDEAFHIHKEYLLRDSTKVGHNVTFDICYLAVTTGVRLAGTIIDTLLALHSLDSGIKGCFSLKTAVFDYLPESGLGGYEDLLQLPEEE